MQQGHIFKSFCKNNWHHLRKPWKTQILALCTYNYKCAWGGYFIQGIRTQIVKSNQTMREPNNEILAIKMI